jgi:hypothetical protein
MIRALIFVGTLIAFAPSANAQTREELQRLLSEREAQIEALRQRLRALEGEATPADENDDELNRALERTLIQQGATVLRRGTYELEPQLSYAHWDSSRTTLRSVSQAALSLRGGLGWDSQIQVRLPYVHASTSAGSTSRAGDIDLSASTQLRREGAGGFGVVATVGWTARTGRDALEGGIATGSGFNVPYAGLTLVKRHDPLVFFGAAFYASPIERTVSDTAVAPGDSVGLRMGAILAASPAASVNVGLDVTRVGAVRLDSQRVPDSDAVVGTLQIGFGTILGPRTMLNVSAEFGLTTNTPDFRVNVALPIRF